MRFTRQQPQHDQFQQMSNFFPEQWSRRRRRCSTSRAAATARSSARATPATRWTRAPAQIILTPPGAANTQVAHRHADSRTRATCSTASARRATASPSTGYTWPTLVFGPRFGAAYDLTGTQTMVSAAAAGCSTTVRTATRCSRSRATRRSPSSQTCATASWRQLGGGLSPVGRAEHGDLPVRREGAGVVAVERGRADGAARGPRRSTSPTSATTATTAWAASRAARVNLNAVDIGAAYLPQNQDPTLARERVPGRDGLHDQPAAAVSRPGEHRPEHDGVLRHVPLDPDVVQPPLPAAGSRSA